MMASGLIRNKGAISWYRHLQKGRKIEKYKVRVTIRNHLLTMDDILYRYCESFSNFPALSQESLEDIGFELIAALDLYQTELTFANQAGHHTSQSERAVALF